MSGFTLGFFAGTATVLIPCSIFLTWLIRQLEKQDAAIKDIHRQSEARTKDYQAFLGGPK